MDWRKFPEEQPEMRKTYWIRYRHEVNVKNDANVFEYSSGRYIGYWACNDWFYAEFGGDIEVTHFAEIEPPMIENI